jgi:adenylate cyclase
MADEIERKFLVSGNAWRECVTERWSLEQGYLAVSEQVSVRIRIKNDAEATLTVKSNTPGMQRSEFEYPVPLADACELMRLCGDLTVRKTRHLCPLGSATWEVDVFEGRHHGLVVAEVELAATDQQFDLPDWIGAEVTDDGRYRNTVLATAGIPVQDLTAPGP